MRETFERSVFEKDGHRCKTCGSAENLTTHCITDCSKMPNRGPVLENVITLCAICRKRARLYSLSDGKMWNRGFHPTDLYQLIGSSYELAVLASRRDARHV